jgi:chromosome segregation ATPase
MLKIKTAKILHTREVMSLRNKLNEEVLEKKRLIEDQLRNRDLDYENNSLKQENEKVSAELNFLKEQFKNAESHATGILGETNEKYKNCVSDLENELNLKVAENNELYQRIQDSEKEVFMVQETVGKIKQELEKIMQKNENLSEINQEIYEKCDYLEKILSEKEKSLKDRDIEIEKLYEKLADQGDALTKASKQIEKYEENLEELIKKSEEDHSEIIFYKTKANKLELVVRELRRERDILFENVKKSPSKTAKEDKEVQTEVLFKSSILKKAIPVKSRMEELESLGKEILEL